MFWGFNYLGERLGNSYLYNKNVFALKKCISKMSLHTSSIHYFQHTVLGRNLHTTLKYSQEFEWVSIYSVGYALR